jgi:hypothetical protein
MGAHAAADTGMCRVCNLHDAVVNAIDVRGLFHQANRYVHLSFPVYPELNGPYRTYGRTLSAQGALGLVPEDMPEKVFLI